MIPLRNNDREQFFKKHDINVSNFQLEDLNFEKEWWIVDQLIDAAAKTLSITKDELLAIEGTSNSEYAIGKLWDLIYYTLRSRIVEQKFIRNTDFFEWWSEFTIPEIPQLTVPKEEDFDEDEEYDKATDKYYKYSITPQQKYYLDRFTLLSNNWSLPQVNAIALEVKTPPFYHEFVDYLKNELWIQEFAELEKHTFSVLQVEKIRRTKSHHLRYGTNTFFVYDWGPLMVVEIDHRTKENWWRKQWRYSSQEFTKFRDDYKERSRMLYWRIFLRFDEE